MSLSGSTLRQRGDSSSDWQSPPTCSQSLTRPPTGCDSEGCWHTESAIWVTRRPLRKLCACCVSEYQDQAERIDLIFFLTGPGPSPKSTGPSARSSSPALSPRGVAKPPWSLLQRCSSRFRLMTTATAPFYLGRGRHSVTHAPIHRCGGSDQSLTDSTMNYSPLSLQSACARH